MPADPLPAPPSFPASAAPADIRQWRKAERARLLGIRRSLDAGRKRRFDAAIRAHLAESIGPVGGLTVSGYAPIAAEPEIAELARAILSRGGRWALPVVERKAAPLVFRTWRPGEPLETGIGGIPVPSGGEAVDPDILIAPVVGFDAGCFRLGYGGGYFDRTLAAARRRPRALGVGYSILKIATIHPQPHDVEMDAIVTEEGVVA